jgi:hypothetical protein
MFVTSGTLNTTATFDESSFIARIFTVLTSAVQNFIALNFTARSS